MIYEQVKRFVRTGFVIFYIGAATSQDREKIEPLHVSKAKETLSSTVETNHSLECAVRNIHILEKEFLQVKWTRFEIELLCDIIFEKPSRFAHCCSFNLDATAVSACLDLLFRIRGRSSANALARNYAFLKEDIQRSRGRRLLMAFEPLRLLISPIKFIYLHTCTRNGSIKVFVHY